MGQKNLVSYHRWEENLYSWFNPNLSFFGSILGAWSGQGEVKKIYMYIYLCVLK